LTRFKKFAVDQGVDLTSVFNLESFILDKNDFNINTATVFGLMNSVFDNYLQESLKCNIDTELDSNQYSELMKYYKDLVLYANSGNLKK